MVSKAGLVRKFLHLLKVTREDGRLETLHDEIHCTFRVWDFIVSSCRRIGILRTEKLETRRPCTLDN